jgi:hypothetical protein
MEHQTLKKWNAVERAIYIVIHGTPYWDKYFKQKNANLYQTVKNSNSCHNKGEQQLKNGYK